MIRIYLILVWSIVFNVLFAQIDEVLVSALKDSKVAHASRLLEESKGLKFNSPWIKSVQARFGITGSVLGDTIYGYLRNEDNFGLIVQTNSFRQIKRQKDYKNALLDYCQVDYDIALEAALYSRYLAIINYQFNFNKIQLLEELESLVIQKQVALRKKVVSGLEFKIKEVIDVEETRFDLSNELFQFKQDYIANKQLLDEYRSRADSMRFDQTNFLMVDQIIFKLKDFLINSNNVVKYNTNRVKANLAKANLDYVESQNKNILNDFRVSYDDPLYLVRPNKFNPLNNISFRIGLNLPISGNNNFKRSEARIDFLKEQLEDQRLTLIQEKKMNELRANLNTLIELYQKCKQQKEESIVTSILELPVLKANIDALDWVDLKIRSIELSLQILSVSRDITRAYIQFHNLNNSLHQRPLINYLDKRKPIIE